MNIYRRDTAPKQWQGQWWHDYRQQAEEDREEMRAQQSEQPARDATRKKATDEQFEIAHGNINEQFETSKTEHKQLIISTNEETPANEIAQPAIFQKNGKIYPGAIASH